MASTTLGSGDIAASAAQPLSIDDAIRTINDMYALPGPSPTAEECMEAIGLEPIWGDMYYGLSVAGLTVPECIKVIYEFGED